MCRLFVDAGKKGLGIVIHSWDGEQYIVSKSREDYPYEWYNEGEFKALLEGLKECTTLKEEKVLAYTDSQIVYGSVMGWMKIKKIYPHLRKVLAEIRYMVGVRRGSEFVRGRKFKEFMINKIKGEDNPADRYTK